MLLDLFREPRQQAPEQQIIPELDATDDPPQLRAGISPRCPVSRCRCDYRSLNN